MNSTTKAKESAANKKDVQSSNETAAPARASLTDRLPDMTDKEIVALQTNAIRIAGDAKHKANASAVEALPMIEAEIAKRAESKAGADAERKKASAAKRAATLQARKKAAAEAKAAAKAAD